MSRRAAADEAVAVVGLGCTFPGAPDVDAFWRIVVDGADATSEVPPERIDPILLAALDDGGVAHRGGFVGPESLTFDAARFGTMPVAVAGTEPDQLLALRTAAAALDDLGGLDGVPLERVGVVLGRGGYLTPGVARLDQRVRGLPQVLATLRDLLPELAEDRLAEVAEAFRERLGEAHPEASIGLVPNLAASRIANRLDLGGPAYTVDAACASALVAVDHAVAELRRGRCDLVLAGGVHHCHDITLWSVFDQLGALSASRALRPFSRRADGIVIGEGTGIVVLERLADAERRGHRTYATIAGTGLSSDGRDASLMSPRVDGQVLALERAYAAASVDPASVGLVEGHGTATAAGDRAELDTIRRVFGKADGPTPLGVLGSVKATIGHAMPAAGAAGLIKAVLAVHHGVLPPTPGADEPHPALAETRFTTLERAEPWEGRPGLRRAGVNAFGFGGVNAHVVVDQHGAAGTARSRSSGRREPAGSAAPAAPALELDALVLAGGDVAELLDRLDEWVARRDAGRPTPTPARPPEEVPVRLVVAEPTAKRLALARRLVEKGRPWRGRNDIWFATRGLLAEGGAVTFLFPGVEPTFEADLDSVADRLGLPRLAVPEGVGPLEAQGHQIFGAGRLLDRAVRALGVVPDSIAGHSLGEWTGLFSAELVPPEQADGFVEGLGAGRLEVPGVVYVALGCGADRAAELIAGVPGMVVSHDNCPHQSVVCGPPEAVAAVRERMAEQKVLGQELPFRSGFHSPAFAPYLPAVQRAWAAMPLQAGTLPLWSATTCAPYPGDPDAVRALSADHLVRPVRFRELVERLHDEGTRAFVQLGVGSLVGFVEDTLRDRDHVAVAAHTARRGGLDQLALAVLALWVEGARPDLTPLLGPPAMPAAAGATGWADRTDGGRSQEVPLHLGVPVVRLSPGAVPALAAPAVPARAEAAVSPVAGRLADAHAALVDEALDAGRAVLEAFARPRTVAVTSPGASERGAARSTGTPPDPVIATPPGAAGGEVERTIRVDLATMPWLADHAFYRQAEGWPDPADHFPLVPMTGMVELLADVARDLAPGAVVTAVERVRAMRWLPAAPGQDVTVRARRRDDGAVEAAIDGYARAVVRLADELPPAPPAAATPVDEPRPSPLPVEEVYRRHFLFHGPAYQGVRSIDALGRDGADGVVEVMAAPGATLDAAGQVYGWWVMEAAETNFLALPSAIERIEWFAHPPVGTPLTTRVRITDLDERTVAADLELADGDRLAVRISGWVDRRFDSTTELWAMLRDPEDHLLAHLVDEHVAVALEGWPDSASRELMARRYLDADERAVYEARNPRAQRHHLLGRVALKDLLRWASWREGAGPLFPAEAHVANDEAGRPHVRSGPGAGRPVSVAHTSWVGVAVVGVPGGPPVGVDVEVVAPRSPEAVAAVASDDELALLPGAPGPDDVDPEWFTRLWCAKEAAGKALGTGLAGRPRDLVLTEVDGERLRVGERWTTTAVLAPTPGPSSGTHRDRAAEPGLPAPPPLRAAAVEADRQAAPPPSPDPRTDPRTDPPTTHPERERERHVIAWTDPDR